jgi:hypothetical protein
MRGARSITPAIALSALITAAVATGAQTPAASPPHHPATTPAGVTTVRELSQLRNEYSDTYLLSDGTRSVKIYPQPINYKAPDGSWQPVNEKLVERSPGHWSPIASQVSVSLPNDPAAGPATIGDGSSALSFQLQGANHTAGTAKGSRRSYASILPGVAATYTAGPKALRETLTLENNQAPTSYTYNLTLAPGMRAHKTAGGAISVESAASKPLYTIPAPLISDASGSTLPQSAPVHYELGPDSRTLTLLVDKSWLQAPGRAFPVRIDPDVYFGEEEDCLVASAANANTGLCGAPLYVGAGEGSPKEVARSLLHFDLSAVPADADILRSRLGLWFTRDTTTSTIPIEARALTHSFTSAATWNSYDGTHNWSSPGGDFEPETAGETAIKDSYTEWWVNWGFTPEVQKWIAEPASNDGILLKAKDDRDRL